MSFGSRTTTAERGRRTGAAEETNVSEYPQKDFYKLSEVCQYTDTQPYVLRFWESEFPQLSPDKRGGGARVYRKSDIDLVCRIKQLLYDEEYTIAGAREVLDDEKGRGGKRRRPVAAKKAKPKSEAEPAPAARAEARRPVQRSFEEAVEEPAIIVPMRRPAAMEHEPPNELDVDSVARARYEDAVDEIDHLRLQLKEAEKGLRKSEAAQTSAEEEAARHRDRSVRALNRLESLLKNLEA